MYSPGLTSTIAVALRSNRGCHWGHSDGMARTAALIKRRAMTQVA